MSINIKKSHKGLLHKNLGVPEGEKIPASKLKIKASDSPAVKKRKQFALNAKKFKHAEDGLILSDPNKPYDPITNPDGYKVLADKPGAFEQMFVDNGYLTKENPRTNAKSIDRAYNSLLTMAPEPAMPYKPGQPSNYNFPAPEYDFSRMRNPADLGNYQPVEKIQTNPAPITPLQAKQPLVKPAPSGFNKIPSQEVLVGGLAAIDAFLPKKKPERKYQRPEDLPTYNPNQYGTGSQALMKKGGKIPKHSHKLPKDTIINGKKITAKQRKFFNDLCEMEEGGTLPQYPDGGKQFPIFTQNDVFYTPQNNTLVKNGIENSSVGKRAMVGPPSQNEINYTHPYMPVPEVEGIPNPMLFGNTPEMNIKSSIKMKKGGKMKYCENGLTVEDNQIEPLSPYTAVASGPSHANGGIQASFGGQNFEMEGGEPLAKNPNGELVIYGNMKNPLTGNKFKQDAKMIAKKEAKADKYKTLGSTLVNDSDPTNKWERLTFNAGKAMMTGGAQKLQELQVSKQHLSDIQDVMLQDKAEKKAKNGLKMYPDGGKPWDYRKTNTANLDKKIKDFVKLVEQRGWEGYSGEKSGFDLRNTKSGRPSRHSTNQALDMMFTDPKIYDKILQDKELVKYMFDNGLTAINEYDPAVQSLTGASTGHIHIGYDKGTATSDAFRKTASQLYPDIKGTKRVASPNITPYSSAPTGDAQTEFPGFTEQMVGPKTPTNPQRVQKTDYQFNLRQPAPINKPSNAEGVPFSQLSPEIFTLATNREEPVQMQKFQPDLYSPYQVSFQDRINQNNSQFNAFRKALPNNPSGLATLASQQYGANDTVKAEEFRTNQGIANDITNKNVSLINDAKLKNLQIGDLQYTRQAQAHANTKDQDFLAISSISDKLAKNRLENRTLQVVENMYPYYSFNPDNNFKADFYGPKGADAVDFSSVPGQTNYPMEMAIKETTVPGKPTKTERAWTTPEDPIQKALLRKLRNPNFKNGAIVKASKFSY